MKSRPEPTTTAFAILGMIAIRPMSPYELAGWFDRSLGKLWPRARSKLFEGPKNLVALGYAKALKERSGGRGKTIYSITPAGRRALASWLEQPGTGPQIEFEQLLKVFYVEHGSKRGALANLRAAADWAHEQIEHNAEVGRIYLAGKGPFQERAAQVYLTGVFLSELSLLVDTWARWAVDVAEKWPADMKDATPDREALAAITRKLERRLSTLRKLREESA
ncbi:MAG TPA: PadR family transcriptional regulator [Actinomycetota bacterium]|nr:PadR family transcriptional regulator [Actinomycetota bacterium]